MCYFFPASSLVLLSGPGNEIDILISVHKRACNGNVTSLRARGRQWLHTVETYCNRSLCRFNDISTSCDHDVTTIF